MIASKPQEQTNRLADQVAESADHAIRSTQRVANEALDGMADTVQDIRHEAAPLLNRAAEQASTLKQRGLDAVRNSSHQLQDKAQRASASTVKFVRDRPIRAMVIASAAGAALTAITGLFRRSRDRG